MSAYKTCSQLLESGTARQPERTDYDKKAMMLYDTLSLSANTESPCADSFGLLVAGCNVSEGYKKNVKKTQTKSRRNVVERFKKTNNLRNKLYIKKNRK